MEATPPQKVLIVLLGAIGDVARALPIAVRIKKHWPKTELHWAVEPISKSLLEGHPAIDQLKVFDRPKGFSAFREFLKDIRSERYELVLDMQRHLKSGVSAWSTKAPRRIGFHRRNSRECNWLFSTEHISPSQHFSSKTIQFQKFGDVLGLAELSPLEFGLSATPEERVKIESLIGREKKAQKHFIAFILGSTWPSRFWQAEAYAQLALRLAQDFSIHSLLLGAKGEREFAERIMTLSGPGAATNLVGKTSLRDLVPVFERASCALGSDSGPMHIAAAVGCPVISLWGSTSPARSAPYGSESLVMQSAMGCSPCYRKQCPGLDTECMKDISWQAVFAQVKALLSPAMANT